ncbi:MAG: hypothetical protein IJ094_12875 [Bacilli bacterium]|nr:hypothetical protein [Bacilli bacterium]
MDLLKKFNKQTVIDAAIVQCGEELKNFDPYSAEYKFMCDNILTLSEAKSKTQLDAKSKKLIITYLGGILLILLYENSKIITTKAFNLITKIV